MVEQPPVLKPENKPKDEPKAPDKPPGPPTPAASGPPSDFGLGGPGGGGGGGGGGTGGSRWGWYAGEVQSRIADALRQNDKTKDARFRIKVRVWVNTSGSITRATLADSSGDATVDQALKNQVLVGLNLPEAPPSDMPMPIVMMINEQRPN
jgi:protein TonB